MRAQEPDGWRLEIPAGPAGAYRIAQLDDYRGRERAALPWQPPLVVSLYARASAADLPGTWGFGLWNDPFSLSLGLGGGIRRFPALPNCAWFFFASPENYLSLRDDLPANGGLAASFRSPVWPAWLLASAAPLLGLLALPPLARLARRLGRRLVQQSAVVLAHHPQTWAHYRLEWRGERLLFQVNSESVLETTCTPPGPLGLVLWVDNQYAAFTPQGRFRYGTLAASQPAWIEIRQLAVTALP